MKLRKLIRAQINSLGDDEVEVVMSTDALARDGHILIPQGCQLENYRANPIVLWSHNPDLPLGNAENAAVGLDQITARVRFAPAGISRKADEIRGLVKSGVVRAVSIAFDPIEMEPLDPKKPRAGQRISAWELLELSFVSVPSDTGAVVTARAHGDQPVTKPQPATTRAQPIAVTGKLTLTRGLYAVAGLCETFEWLGYHVDMAKWEAMIEGDDSKVPAMLLSALQKLGDALIAMTEEEVAEALAGHDIEPELDAGDDVLVDSDRAHIAAAKSSHVRAWRRGRAHAKLRAGKTLSADTVRCLQDAQAAHSDAIDMHRTAIAKHKAAMGAVDDMMDRAGVADSADDPQVQDSGGDVPADEGARAFDYRKRQAQALALAGAH